MQQNISEKTLYEILGTKLHDKSVIDDKIEEAYAIIRQSNQKTLKKQKKNKKKRLQKVFIGLGSAAAVLLLTFAFCVMNPVMASEIPVLGDLFAKVADVFPFGRIPEEEAELLYEEEIEKVDGEGTESSYEGEKKALYQVTEGDITVTLEEKYVSNQAVFIGIRIESVQEFPEMAAYVESGTQWFDVRTKENYSFRPDQITSRRRIEGKLEDAHTFIGIMRIDYSEISVDYSKYNKAVDEADAKGEEYPEINNLTREEWLDYYEIPESFNMTLEITQIVGILKESTRPEGMKSDEEMAQMSDEELGEYRNSLPKEWVGYPNIYQHWYRDGSWLFTIPITPTDSIGRVISVNEVNASGLGIESIELSTMEMTLNTIEQTMDAIWPVVFDADGKEIACGENNNVYMIAGHDVSTLYVYLCDFDDWSDAKAEREKPDGEKKFRELIEACALFSTTVNTTE